MSQDKLNGLLIVGLVGMILISIFLISLNLKSERLIKELIIKQNECFGKINGAVPYQEKVVKWLQLLNIT